MAFIQSCFIRKNTNELIDKLIEFGYKDGGCEDSSENFKCIYVSSIAGRFYRVHKKPARYESIIDCGENDNMFLALSTLRDDTNEHQWFIAIGTIWDEYCDGEITTYFEKGQWFKYNERSFVKDISSHFRKATVEDIVEHFKIQN